MKRYYLASEDLETWMNQNKANYTGDYVDGCLTDNFILSCKRGYAALYEHYRNEWTSDYLVIFAPYKNTRDVDKLFSDFIKFEERISRSA